MTKTGVPLAAAGAEQLSAYRRSTASDQRLDRTGISGLERVMEVLRPAGVLNHDGHCGRLVLLRSEGKVAFVS